jgi:mannose-1-phosphate guanylyltransferase
MQIDHCLILAAGFGTRMGEIGKSLPKVLWPVFEKSLLELQVAYAKSLGIQKIFINLHHMGELIEKSARESAVFDDVTFLWEKPDILDIGGGVHNLAARADIDYKGNLLILNADQFFYLQKDDLMRVLNLHPDSPATLLSYWVHSNQGYNALDLSGDGRVLGIIKNKEIAPHTKIQTYTGISLVNLSLIDRTKGASAFFESVAQYKSRPIYTKLLNDVDYWDFGTVDRFANTMFKILETYKHHSNHPFLRFLVKEKALKTWKINLNEMSYHARGSRDINLNDEKLNLEMHNCIILRGVPKQTKVENTIVWGEINEQFKNS